MKHFIISVVISSILFTSCCGNSEASTTYTTSTSTNSTITTSTVERVRVISRNGYSEIYFKLENGLIGCTEPYYDDHFELNMIEVGDEISYRVSSNNKHFDDSEGNDYEVMKVTFKKQDKDSSGSDWN